MTTSTLATFSKTGFSAVAVLVGLSAVFHAAHGNEADPREYWGGAPSCWRIIDYACDVAPSGTCDTTICTWFFGYSCPSGSMEYTQRRSTRPICDDRTESGSVNCTYNTPFITCYDGRDCPSNNCMYSATFNVYYCAAPTGPMYFAVTSTRRL
jgi:hypothetical protein